MKTTPKMLIHPFQLSVFTLIFVAAGWFSVSQCFGQATLYTSLADFNAAVSSSSTINFENFAPSSPFSIGDSAFSEGGLTFNNSQNRLFITNPGGPGAYLYPIPGSGQYLWNFDSGTAVNIQFSQPVTAFGADFSGGLEPATGYNGTITANTLGGQQFILNFNGTRGSWTFLGATFSDPVTSLVFSDGAAGFPGPSHEEMLDNVIYAVPEPNDFALILPVALGTLAFRHVKSRRNNL